MENEHRSLAERVKISLDKAVEKGDTWAANDNLNAVALGLAASEEYFSHQSLRVLRIHIAAWQEEKKNGTEQER